MPKITELWAWVATDRSADDEGVPAFKSPAMPGIVLPMMGADRARALSMRPHAQAVAKKTGKSVQLIRSTGIEVVERIEP